MILSDADSPISLLKDLFDDLEYAILHEPITPENLVEKLYISLEMEDQPPQRQFVIELFFVNDVLQAFGSDDDEEDAVISQFTLVLPVVVPAEAHVDIMRLCGLVNRLVPLGAFGLSEADHAVYLRYCLAGESRAIPDVILTQVVSAFEYLCREYMPIFSGICEQTHSVQEFIDRFAETGHAIPSVGDPVKLSGQF